MSRAGKGGDPWKGQFTDEPVDVPEFHDFLQGLRIPYRVLSELSGVPESVIGRWSRGSLTPKYGRAMDALDAVRRRLREKLERVEAVRRAVRKAHGQDRDRRREPEIEARYVENGDRPHVEVEGDEHACTVHDRPQAATYMLFRGGDVVYVGHSTNLFWRLGHHEREKDFDSFAYVEMGTKRRAMDLERALRQQLDPEYNVA